MSDEMKASCGCRVPLGWEPAEHRAECPRSAETRLVWPRDRDAIREALANDDTVLASKEADAVWDQVRRDLKPSKK